MQDGFIIKYNTSDTKQWTRLFGVAGTEACGRAISIDNNGNCFVGGYAASGNLDGQTKTGYYDVCVIKYDSSGTKQWTRLLGAASAESYGNGVSVDYNGNCYISGYTQGNLDQQTKTGVQDAFLIKYDSSGNKLWTGLLGSASANTQARAISVDASGKCYIAGYTTSAVTA